METDIAYTQSCLLIFRKNCLNTNTDTGTDNDITVHLKLRYFSRWLTYYKPNKQNMKKKKASQKWQCTTDNESTVPPKSDLMMNLLSTPSCLSVSLL